MILGLPIFDASAPSIRVQGRKLSNWWANLETLWAGIDDSLFGIRLSSLPNSAFNKSHALSTLDATFRF